jgi:hypothetical protein
MNNWLAKQKYNNFYFTTFFAAAIGHCIFLYFRGFGWDGDSFISAMQFVKLLNNNIFSLNDGGTHPKLLSIIIFGLFYQIFGNFKLLTILSILINCIMVASICKWSNAYYRLWWICLIGYLVNIEWLLIVINCDNTAFSIPFIILGLYQYYHNKNKPLGASLLLISNLFRPGSEFVLLGVVTLELLYGNKSLNTYLWLFISTLMALIHSKFGIYLAYLTENQFIYQCLFYPNMNADIAIYKNSVKAIIPFLNTVYEHVTGKYNILFLFISIISVKKLIKDSNDLAYIMLAPLATMILPIGTYMYGTTISTTFDKIMEITIILPAISSTNQFANYAFDKLNKSMKSIIIIILYIVTCCFLIYAGTLLNSYYEVNNDGTGGMKWKQLTKANHIINTSIDKNVKIYALISFNNLFFFVLDNGLRARKIDVIENETEESMSANKYDIIIIPSGYISRLPANLLDNYIKYDANANNNVFIRKKL